MAVLKPFLPTKKENKVLAAYKRWIEKKQSILVSAKKSMKTKTASQKLTPLQQAAVATVKALHKKHSAPIKQECVIPPNDLTGIDLSKIKKVCTNPSCGCSVLKNVQPPFSDIDMQKYYDEILRLQNSQLQQAQQQVQNIGYYENGLPVAIPNRIMPNNLPQIGQAIPMPPQIGGLAQIQSITTGGTNANKPF